MWCCLVHMSIGSVSIKEVVLSLMLSILCLYVMLSCPHEYWFCVYQGSLVPNVINYVFICDVVLSTWVLVLCLINEVVLSLMLSIMFLYVMLSCPYDHWLCVYGVLNINHSICIWSVMLFCQSIYAFCVNYFCFVYAQYYHVHGHELCMLPLYCLFHISLLLWLYPMLSCPYGYWVYLYHWHVTWPYHNLLSVFLMLPCPYDIVFCVSPESCPDLIALYNYHPCWSVTRRFVSQRKVRSPEGLPEGDLTFRGETNRRVTLQQGWWLVYYIEYFCMRHQVIE